MILRSVELESFGRFRDQTVEFRRGMNLVIGPNEAGKSTIAEAIPAVLFGTDRLERFKPWGRNVCSAVLFFEGQGRTIQVKRNLITDEVELVEKDDLYHILSQFSGKVPLRGRGASCREYRALLESLLGVADESLFRATYFFGHQPKEWSGEELAQKLRTLVSGTAETDYAEILDTLLDEHFQLTRSNPWGRDKQRDRDYEEVCQQLAAQGETAPVASVPVFVEIDSSADTEEQIEKLFIELENDQKEYEKGLRYIERIRRQSVESSEDVAATVAEKNPEILEDQGDEGDKRTLSEQLVAVGLPKNPPRDLPELLAEAAEVRQQFAKLQQPFSVLNSREKKIPTVPWLMLLAILALLIPGGTFAWWQDFLFPLISLGAGLCSTLLLGWGGWRHMVRKKALDECRKERSRLEQQKLVAQKRQTDLTNRCEALGLPSSAIDLVRVQKLVTAHSELLESWWKHGDLPVAESSVPQNISEGDSAEAATSTNTSVVSEEAEQEVGQELGQLEARMSEFRVELEQKELRLKTMQLQVKEPSSDQRPSHTTSAQLCTIASWS